MGTPSRTWNRRDLQRELRRRERFPAQSDLFGYTTPQVVSLEELREELARTCPDHPDRRWREYEYALAVEHYRQSPDVPFVRSVEAEVAVH